MINVCESENSGSADNLVMELENENGETCQTDPIKNFERNKLDFKSSKQFDREGTGCKKLTITPITKVYLFNKGMSLEIFTLQLKDAYFFI